MRKAAIHTQKKKTLDRKGRNLVVKREKEMIGKKDVRAKLKLGKRPRQEIKTVNREDKGKNSGRHNKFSTNMKVEEKNKIILNVDVDRTPNSCLVYIGNTRWRALIDTGADISIISEKMYQRLKINRG